MAQIDLAVVIPTLNEEDYIGKLLDSLAIQTVQPREIVVVDATSKDKTIEEIKKRQRKLPQLKWYQIPKYTISRQRNLGARKTRASHILFLDADVVLKDEDTLEKYVEEIERKNPDVAACTNVADSDHPLDKAFYKGMDLSYRALKPIWPMANTINFYIKRSVFENVGGFDEEVKIGEDHELLQRIVKSGYTFMFLKGPKVYTSVRRIQKSGRIKFALAMAVSLGLVMAVGYRKNPMAKKYEFGKFKK